jgi:hypothetical protein
VKRHEVSTLGLALALLERVHAQPSARPRASVPEGNGKGWTAEDVGFPAP